MLPTPQQLQQRQLSIIDQLKTLESKIGRLKQRVDKLNGAAETGNKTNNKKKKEESTPPAPSSSSSSLVLPSDSDPSCWWDASTYTADNAGVVPSLTAECVRLGMSRFRFYRVSSDYYSWTLEQRRDVLGVQSTGQLFKSVLMENTHFKEPESEGNRKFIVVIVSYTEKLQKEKLNIATYEHYKSYTLSQTPPLPLLSKRAFDSSWRLADATEAQSLSGYEHNATCPVGMKTRLLMVLSDSALKAQGGSLCLGGGEVDVKWRVSVKQFVETFKPIVANICVPE